MESFFLELVKDGWYFFKTRAKYWLASLVIFKQGLAFSSFIYSIV